MLDFDNDDYADFDTVAFLAEQAGEPELDDRVELTCMGCGEVFLASWWDDCPVCGAPADGA